MNRPTCPLCTVPGELTVYLHHEHGCLRCLAKAQKRIIVPFEDFMDRYFDKYKQELPIIKAMAEEMSAEDFNKNLLLGKFDFTQRVE